MDIWISLSASNPLVPGRKLKVERAKKNMELAQKDLAQFRTAIGKKKPEEKPKLNAKLKLKQDRNTRMRSRVSVENQKLSIAQQIDGLEASKQRAKDSGQKEQIKTIQARIDKLKKRMTEVKPVKRTGGAKKTVRRKVFVKNP